MLTGRHGEKQVKRVLTEHEILSSTDHPFIVSLHASFQVGFLFAAL
jgi:hypothetical protein